MLWIKAFHVIFMVCWFAGLFYLPRIFVYYAQAPDAETRPNPRVNGAKALPICHAFYAPHHRLWALAAELSMGLLPHRALDAGQTGRCLPFLIGYHLQCGVYMRRIGNGEDDKTHVFYRFFNEVPVLFLFAIVLLVYVRPF